MPLPKAIVFDLGKVLVDFDYGIAARKLASCGRVPLEAFSGILGQTPLLLNYECGKLTTEGFFSEVCAATGYSGSIDEFGVCFADIFSPIEPMIQMHAIVRERGFRTYIFSNTNNLAVGHIRREFPFFANFDGYIFSFEHGAMKPNPALYHVVERQTGCRGADILYVDDRPENIEVGKSLGWQVVLQTGPEESIQAFRSLGLFGPELAAVGAAPELALVADGTQRLSR